MFRILFFSFILMASLPVYAQHENHGAHSHKGHTAPNESEGKSDTPIRISQTPEITAALADGGAPVVIEVLGVVCDFCATAMNKTFSRREEISAVYVDLDAKTLNLVIKPGFALDDKTLKKLVTRSGYKTKVVHRGAHLLGGNHETNPS